MVSKRIVLFCVVMFMGLSSLIFAQTEEPGEEIPEKEKESEFYFTAGLLYDILKFDDRSIHSPGAGIRLSFGDGNPVNVDETRNLLISGTYKARVFGEAPGYDYPSLFHDLEFRTHGKVGRHQFFYSSTAASPTSRSTADCAP